MKNNKGMILAFTLPCVLSLVIMFLYPVIRTVVMSFFQVESVTSAVSEWKFYGFGNYLKLFHAPIWRSAMWNMVRIWFIGGIFTLGIALLFAVILTSGIRGKKFFRAAIYLPNVISAVALATMWVQFVFNYDFGLINNIIGLFGMEKIKWLGQDYKFWAMLSAFIFGAVGYYMLIFISGIEGIPADLYEAATIDGASKPAQFFHITVPLLKGIIKTNLTFWTIGATTFFLWSKMFSPLDTEKSTTVPVIYLYDNVFGGSGASTTVRDSGAGAATGVILALIIVAVYYISNHVIKDTDLEY